MEDRYLFKAKRIDNGEWIQGNLILSEDVDEECKAIIIPENNSDMFTQNLDKDLGFENWYKVDISTICQCTGLKDKNGKLIWENDIVKGHRINFGSHRHIGKVKYINGRYEIIGVKQYAGFSDALSLSYEVLGNIFDNPELLSY